MTNYIMLSIMYFVFGEMFSIKPLVKDYSLFTFLCVEIWNIPQQFLLFHYPLLWSFFSSLLYPALLCSSLLLSSVFSSFPFSTLILFILLCSFRIIRTMPGLKRGNTGDDFESDVDALIESRRASIIKRNYSQVCRDETQINRTYLRLFSKLYLVDENDSKYSVNVLFWY